MPLRINLLAEKHALEEMRRRDPVKRALWIGAFLALCVLIYSSSLFAAYMIGKNDLSRMQSTMDLRANDYKQILDNKKKMEDANVKLLALNRFATNRFLTGDLLNALQQTARSEIQLLHVHLDQGYVSTEEIKARPEDGVAFRPASSTEKITLVIDARAVGQKENTLSSQFQQALAESPYFKKAFADPVQIRLKQISMPQVDAEGKVAVNFSLECNFPDRKR